MKLKILAAVLLLVSMPVIATPPDSASSDVRNPYRTSYKSIRPPAMPALAEPMLYRGVDRASDDQRLLEDGFDMLGYSRFEAGDVPPEQALEMATELKADMVLVYTARAGGTPASVKMEKARSRAKADAGEVLTEKGVIYYAYQATFWTRLPPPILGLHVRSLTNDDAVERGVVVMAVIHDSPAERAGLLAGDTLTGLGQATITTAGDLLQATRRYAGQSVEVIWYRGGEMMRQTVALNKKTSN